ncbi:hypothetical protein RvY_14971 [Ramazzottius varieornatus]|uniref:Uncharacterized protein n=1 Tax=Ramazzottius varieornatus TaxID=947166 RepID=A0A1D1VY36_RAMVA|nr:hypothetical protein RvY_14971 [Ramazzottius varieornatus]
MKVKDDILKQAGLGFTPWEFVVEKYKSQVVAGYNTSLKDRNSGRDELFTARQLQAACSSRRFHQRDRHRECGFAVTAYCMLSESVRRSAENWYTVQLVGHIDKLQSCSHCK